MRLTIAAFCGIALVALVGGCNIILGLEPATLITSDAGTGAGTTATSGTTGTTTTTGSGSCTDGVLDGQETDVDCGGPVCDAEDHLCAFGKKCKADADCVTCFCNGATCDALRISPAQHAVGVAVDATNVYWTDPGGGDVAKAPTGGGTAATMLATGQDVPSAITVDATSVYWTTSDSVLSVPIGGGTTNVIASGQNDVTYLAVNGTSVFWNVNGGTGGSVMTASLDGGSMSAIASSMLKPQGIALDATNVYWTTFSGVRWAPLAGGASSLLAGTNNGEAIVVSGGSAYWASVTAAMSAVESAPTNSDGGLPNVIASGTDTNPPPGLAVDSTNVYWTDTAAGTVMKTPIAGGTTTTIVSGQNGPIGVVVDSTYVYWADGSSVKKACK